jgi:dCTP deaminase
VILTGTAIESEVARGRIVISPFESSQVNPNSYNYRLGRFLRTRTTLLSRSASTYRWQTISLNADGALLMPGVLYLGSTYERIGSNYYVPSLIGRSSVGRLGLYLQLSADLGQLGLVHHWTLELSATQPLRVYAGMIIGQVSFWRPRGVRSRYTGRYIDTDLPTPSRDFGRFDSLPSGISLPEAPL